MNPVQLIVAIWLIVGAVYWMWAFMAVRDATAKTITVAIMFVLVSRVVFALLLSKGGFW